MNFIRWFVILFTSGLLLFHPLLHSQERLWTLEECVRYAIENNIQIRQQELVTRYQGNILQQSRFDLLPNLNASAAHNYSYGRALDETTYGFAEETERIQSNSFSAAGGVTLFSGFQKTNSVRQSRYDLLASKEDLQRIKNDIALNIALAYLQILFSEELVEVARNQLDITRLQADRTRKLVSAGSLPQGSLLEIIAQEAAEELQLVNSHNQLDISYLNLVQLLEFDSVAGFRIVHPEIELEAEQELLYSVGEVFSEAMSFLPQIKSAELQLKSSETGWNIARGLRYPSLTMNLYYGTRYSDIRQRLQIDNNGIPVTDPVTGFPVYEQYPFWDQLSDNISYGFGFSLAIPVFNNWRINTAISQSRIGVMNSQLALENAHKQLLREVQQKFADALAALKKYKASQEAVSSMEESFRYTEQKFNVGMVTPVEYNTSKNLLARTLSDLLQAKYEYVFKIKVLEFYMGQPLQL